VRLSGCRDRAFCRLDLDRDGHFTRRLRSQHPHRLLTATNGTFTSNTSMALIARSGQHLPRSTRDKVPRLYSTRGLTCRRCVGSGRRGGAQSGARRGGARRRPALGSHGAGVRVDCAQCVGACGVRLGGRDHVSTLGMSVRDVTGSGRHCMRDRVGRQHLPRTSEMPVPAKAKDPMVSLGE